MTREDQARFLRKGDVFTYVGAFKFYVATSNATPDESFPGRVRIRVTNEPGGRELDIWCRLKADQLVTRKIGEQPWEDKARFSLRTDDDWFFISQ